MYPSVSKSLASRRLKFQLVFIVIFVGFMLLLSWLILGETSPFHNYFLYNVGISNAWASTMLIPYILAAIIAGNPHSGSEVVTVFFSIVQWAIVGWLISIPLSRLWTRLQNK